MEVTIGKEGLSKSWQAEFPETTICCKCKGTARIGFVAHEGMSGENPKKTPVVWKLHQTQGKGSYWLHDHCAVAVYFCKDCFAVTVLWNQR